MRWAFLFVYCALFTLNSSTRGEWGQIKINEPRASYSNNNNNNYNNDNSNSNNNNNNNNGGSSSYRDPHSETENSDIVIPSVIEYLTSRKGETVEGTHDKYTYKVMLFDKVEQSENWYSWNLGIFDKWDYCDSTTQNELCLQYTDGQVCGNGVGRSSHIHIICDIGDKDNTKEHLFDVTEPLTCSYHMKMYIPQICQLLNNNVNNIFVANDNIINNGQTQVTQPQTQTQKQNGDDVNIISDTSGVMNKLNDIMNQQNEQNELDQLWKLCLMSLMIDDQSKLNKIRDVANIFMVKSKDNTKDVKDMDSKQTEICDFYLEQMLINNDKKETETAATDPPLAPNNDVIETISDDNNNAITDDETDVNVGNVGNVKENKMGGLVDEINDDVDNDLLIDNDNNPDEIVPEEFKGDKIVFQSGNNQNDEIVFQSGNNQNDNDEQQQNDIIEDGDDEQDQQEVLNADIVGSDRDL